MADKRGTETFTWHGATRLANIIRRYWKDRGFKVDVWLEPITYRPGDTGRDRVHAAPEKIWQIRSNIAKSGLLR